MANRLQGLLYPLRRQFQRYPIAAWSIAVGVPLIIIIASPQAEQSPVTTNTQPAITEATQSAYEQTLDPVTTVTTEVPVSQTVEEQPEPELQTFVVKQSEGGFTVADDWHFVVDQTFINDSGDLLGEYDYAIVQAKLTNTGKRSIQIPYNDAAFTLTSKSGEQYSLDNRKTRIPHEPINPGVTKTVWLVFQVPKSDHKTAMIDPDKYQLDITLFTGGLITVKLDQMGDLVKVRQDVDDYHARESSTQTMETIE